MTEDTGFAEPEPGPDAEAAQEPVEDARPVPPVDADPQEVAEEAAGAEPGPADHVPPPWLPSDGVADWLRSAIHELHRRLQNLGG